jgi:hypothetical protein
VKKYLPYLFGSLFLAAAVLLFATAGNKKIKKKLDERITLRRQDKIPYGTYAAFNSLKDLFPGAKIYTGREEPGYWDSLSRYEDKQALIIITNRFAADESEMKKLISFAENGNDVFISASYVSADAAGILNCKVQDSYYSMLGPAYELDDSMEIMLNNPIFGNTKQYQYPGRTCGSYFIDVDTTTTEVLGYDGQYRPNFIRLHAGRGNFYMHIEPFAFTNYFILHKENADYYEKALSVIRPGARKLMWDEYFITKREFNYRPDDRKNKKEWLSSLLNLKNPEGRKSFGAAFWTLFFLLLLFVLMNMRRRQRYIPVIKNPVNDSLDFVKTIGRLYYDKSDHKNLCRKMSAYFLEHVRNRYKLPTGNLDEAFIKSLLYKSGAEEPNARMIISFIKYLEDAPIIGKEQLIQFHRQLEVFYSTT